jgi:hypothetical protein
MATYDTGPGSTRVNMGLKGQAPFSQYSTLIVTGTTYKAQKMGLPSPADFARLDALSADVIATIESRTPSMYVGTFTSDSEQLHYVYVKDAAGIEAALNALYAKVCVGCKTHIKIKQDPAWSAYRDFLYPNQATRDFYRAELRKLEN